MFNEKTMEGPGTSTSEENVGTMLPTIGLNGEPVVQKDVKPAMLDKLEDDVEDMEDDNNVLKLSESVIDYINDINREYDTDVQEGVKEVIDGYESDVTVSPEIKNLIVEITTKRAKMKKIMDNKNTSLSDKKEVIDLKRDIIFLQQKLNKLTKKGSLELKKEVTKIKEYVEQEILDKRSKMNDEIVDYKKPEEDKKDDEEIKESVDDVIIESSEDDDDWILSVIGILATGAFISGLLIYDFKQTKKLRQNMKKIENYLSKNKDFISPKDMTKKTYRGKYILGKVENTGEEIKTKKIKDNTIVVVYMYKDKPIFTYSKDRSYSGDSNRVEVCFAINNKKIKKYEEFYMAYVCMHENVEYRGTVNWVQKFMKEHEKELQEVKESVIIESDDEEKKKLPPELKRLDEKRGRLEKLKDELREAREKFKETGERRFENKIKGLTANIEKLQKEIEADEKKVAEHNEEATVTEAANMEDEIKPIVEKLERKGYKVKYASPGHKNLRKKEDKEPDGKYYGKLYSDARVMFDKVYDFPSDAPKYWHWREVDGCSYLDITPLNHKESDGSIDEAFAKWKVNYMNSLRKFVDDLKDNGSKKVEESVDDYEYDELIEESVDDFSNEELFEEAFGLDDGTLMLGILGALTAGIVVSCIKSSIDYRLNMKKADQILSLEKGFLSPKKDLTRRIYKAKKVLDRLESDGHEISKFARLFYNHVIIVYFHKDKPIFTYAVSVDTRIRPGIVAYSDGGLGLSANITRSKKFTFGMIDKSMAKYEDYYFAFSCLKEGMQASETARWAKKFVKEHKEELKELKTKKESVDEFSDDLMNDIFERMGFDELSFEDEIVTESVDLETNSSKTIIDELNDLLS